MTILIICIPFSIFICSFFIVIFNVPMNFGHLWGPRKCIVVDKIGKAVSRQWRVFPSDKLSGLVILDKSSTNAPLVRFPAVTSLKEKKIISQNKTSSWNLIFFSIDATEGRRGLKSGPFLPKFSQNLLIKIKWNPQKVYPPQKKFHTPIYPSLRKLSKTLPWIFKLCTSMFFSFV
jgi:hypothetical protein